MGVFSTLYWLVGNGTYSIGQQQAWIMWYSVTYQGTTIPLFWLITAFTLQLLFNEDLTYPKKQLLVLLTITGLVIITFFHPSEAIYYAIFLFLSLLLTSSISLKRKVIYGILFFTVFPCLLFISATYMELPFLRNLSTQNSFIALIQQIEAIGRHTTEKGGNRLHSSFSELAILSSIIVLVYWTVTVAFFRKKMNRITTLLIFAVIIFFLIPTSKWIAGITGVLLHEKIIWRFFFASPWFLFIPFIVFTLTSHSRFPKTYGSLLLIGILSGTSVMSHAYFDKALSGNIQSLYNSFLKERVGLQYSAETLDLLKQTIDRQTGDTEKKDIILYIRSDLATLSRAVFGYYAYTHRRTVIPMRKFYHKRLRHRYKLIPIYLPPDFPKERDIFRHFKLDGKYISTPLTPILKGDTLVHFSLEHVDRGKGYIFIEGWAFLEPQQCQSEVYVILQSNQETFMFNTSQIFRRDVGKYFKSQKLENQGFLATIKTGDIKPGVYRVGILVKQREQQGLVFSERWVKIPGANLRKSN